MNSSRDFHLNSCTWRRYYIPAIDGLAVFICNFQLNRLVQHQCHGDGENMTSERDYVIGMPGSSFKRSSIIDQVQVFTRVDARWHTTSTGVGYIDLESW
jgi:hypothetical protein